MSFMKKIVSLILVLVFCMTSSTLALAEGSVQPRIWDRTVNTLNPNTITYDIPFNIPERYFAYEFYATGVNGQPVTNGSYVVALMYDVTALIASGSGDADGTVYKVDWIDLDPDNYQFKIFNYTDSPITVTITYYSWT